jgi:polyketide synthase PksN
MATWFSEQILESVLIEVMSEVLTLEKHEIDAEESLSEYGLDSIMLAEFASRIVRLYPFMRLEPSTFLELPTLSKLASFLAAKYKTELLNAAESAASMSAQPADQKLSEKQRLVESGPTIAGESPASSAQHREASENDIAIIGMAGRFPGAENIGEFWKGLIEEKSLFTQIPPERWDWKAYFGDPLEEDSKTDCCYGAFLQDVGRFDPEHFGISPAEAELLDPQHRILLELAWETIENAGYRKSTLHNHRVGVFIGVEKQDYKELINKSPFELNPYSNAGNTHSMLANRISYCFNWRGPSMAIDTACSSSLAAIGQACDSLRSNRAELALAGGINVLLTPWIFVVNRKLGMLTNEPVMRPFDGRAAGHLNGEGAGLVLLKKLSSAIADNDTIYGVIRSVAVQHGGRGVFLTAPNPESHQSVVADALSEAGLEAKDIRYIEAQGTADPASDKVELKTYQAIFGGSRAEPVKIGTVKGNIGHLGAASGVTALVKTVLSLRNNKLPRILHLEELNWSPEDGKFQCELVSHSQEWNAKAHGSTFIPRRAAVHNFGYGGVNVHAIVEEHIAHSAPEAEPTRPHVIVLSARTQQQLIRQAGNLLDFIRKRDYEHYGNKELHLMDLAYTLQIGREPMEYRMAAVVNNLEELEQKLHLFHQGKPALESVFSGKAEKKKNAQRENLQHKQDDDQELRGPFSNAAAVEIANSWVSGEEIRWPEFYGQTKPRKIPLPTYPFARERYWIPQARDVSNIDLSLSERSSIHMPPEQSVEHRDSSVLGGLVARDLKRQICSLLKIKPDQLDERAGFSDLGFSSHTLAQLASNLSGLFSINVRPTVFFSYSSITELIGYLIQSHHLSLESFYKLEREAGTGVKQHVQRSAPVAKDKATPRPLPTRDEPIAVIGMSGRFPGAQDVGEFWNVLAAGKSMISEIPSNRWDWREYYEPNSAANKIATNRGGFITGVADFDPIFFNLSPREAELIDPRQRLLLQETWRAFEDAGYAGQRLRGTSCGVFIGVEEGEYEKLTGEEALITGHHNGILASRISYLLDLKGPSLAINTACSSGLTAVHLACQSLQRGETDMALTGAVHLLLLPGTYKQLTRMGMLSESGQCFTFDERGDGIVPGEAVAALVLKPLSAAMKDGDNIYGVIKGCGVNYKGKTNGITAPGGLSQKRLIEDVYQKCGIQAGDIDYVAAHGTGTKLGDAVEVSALTEAFRGSTAKTGYCALGAIKNFGHTFAASGIVSMIAVLLAMKNNTLPASLNCDKENEFISLPGSPFYMNKIPAPWIPQPEKKRLAGVSAFGISGTNTHVVLEEYVPALSHQAEVKDREQARAVIVPLSARNEERLREYAGHLLAYVKRQVHRPMSGPFLSDMAYTLQTGRDAMACRVAFLVKDASELIHGLQGFLEGGADENCFHGVAHEDLAILQTMVTDEDMQETIRRWVGKGKLKNVAALWVIGADIEWQLFRFGDEKRISLPTYPFARRMCWFQRREEDVQNRMQAALALETGKNGKAGDRTSPNDSVQLVYSSAQEDSSEDTIARQSLRVKIEASAGKIAQEAHAGGKARTNGAGLDTNAIQSHLITLISKYLHLEKSEIEPRKKFVDMGLDSVFGVELVKQINEHYTLNICPIGLYDYPNIVELARFIHELLMDESDVATIALPEPASLDDKSLPGFHETMAADPIEEQVRDILRQLNAKTLSPDDAEKLITNHL